MRAIAPRTGALEITIAEEQEEYMPITAALYEFDNGARGLLTRWTFTPEERLAIANGEDVYILEVVFNQKMTPLVVRCGPGEFAT